MIELQSIKFDKYQDSLVPVIIQDYISKDIRMLGFMNEEALEITQSTGIVTFYSRSKQRIWQKGESSGNQLRVKSIGLDCDQDSLLIQVEALGPTCHLGTDSCFTENSSFINQLTKTIKSRRIADTEKSYVAKLFANGIDKIAQKVGEEAVETIIEAKNADTNRLISESADLFFHLLILWENQGIAFNDIIIELESRSD
ncbi:MAG: bifunctional phosphoribosyl-AMP cyclohydrolase/phosphoribosyl-ATP diphosphatase HisIE [Calditrichaeota bacterium]|nr:bifunctional phosphoribosyl-AMP cyclohydrolase/phosphoribosyl-ATP diphosphatase HisIE [Calditrichota bacterium]